MKKVIFGLIILSLFGSCCHKEVGNSSLKESQDQLILSVLWFQKSPEMQALFYQGYNNATKSLEEKLKISENKIPKAVVMDIDETILDNSPVEAYQVIHNVGYTDSLWNNWTELAVAEPLPGALEFTLFAQKQGVEVFYVTNRSKATASETTISNLRSRGFPFADSLHLILKTTTSSKEERRQSIASRFEILLFIGDNLGDFDSVFDDRSIDLGFGAVRQNMNKFGDNYIILPNPMYGPWVNAAINGEEGSSTSKKIIKVFKAF